jgi:hypothetical protein
MVLWFRKKIMESDDSRNDLTEYIRLVNYGEASTYLDTDIIQVLELRDSLDNLKGELSDNEQGELKKADDELKRKVETSYRFYNNKIRVGEDKDGYLSGVIVDTKAYGDSEPRTKWWFHLID